MIKKFKFIDVLPNSIKTHSISLNINDVDVDDIDVDIDIDVDVVLSPANHAEILNNRLPHKMITPKTRMKNI